MLKLGNGSAASSGDQGKLTSIGHRLRQHCWFQPFVSYLRVAYDPLVSEEITQHQYKSVKFVIIMTI